MSNEPLEQEFERYAVLLKAIERASAKMPAELAQAITAIKNAVDGVNLLKKYAEGVQDTQKRGELMRAIGELSIELGNAQIQLAQQLTANYELVREVERLQKENEELKNPQTKLTFKNGLYYREDNDGPFCTGCYDSKDKVVRVTELTGAFRSLGKYKCPVCSSVYGQDWNTRP
jgi:hypothetical protein